MSVAACGAGGQKEPQREGDACRDPRDQRQAPPRGGGPPPGVCAEYKLLLVRPGADVRRFQPPCGSAQGALPPSLLCADANSSLLPSAGQEFTYLDRALHDDVYSIIKFSSDEMMNTDQAEKLMGLWRRFVEPLFGVRRAGAENHGLVDSAAEAAAVAVAEEAKKEELAQRDGNLERAAAGDKATAAAEEGGAGGAADMEAEKVDSRAGEAGTEKPERGAAAAAAGLEYMVDAGAEAGGSDAEEEEEEIDEEMADRAGEEDDDETDHEALGRTYAACKPLASAVLVEAGVEGSSDTPLSAREGSVFYANDSIYLLLRLHQHLYERLVVARQSATLMARQTGETATEKHCASPRCWGGGCGPPLSCWQDPHPPICWLTACDPPSQACFFGCSSACSMGASSRPSTRMSAARCWAPTATSCSLWTSSSTRWSSRRRVFSTTPPPQSCSSYTATRLVRPPRCAASPSVVCAAGSTRPLPCRRRGWRRTATACTMPMPACCCTMRLASALSRGRRAHLWAFSCWRVARTRQGPHPRHASAAPRSDSAPCRSVDRERTSPVA